MGCATWIFWTVMNLMGPIKNPDFIALGLDKHVTRSLHKISLKFVFCSGDAFMAHPRPCFCAPLLQTQSAACLNQQQRKDEHVYSHELPRPPPQHW